MGELTRTPRILYTRLRSSASTGGQRAQFVQKNLPVAEARRRLGMPPGGPTAELYGEVRIPAAMAEALRREWKAFDKPV